MNILQNALKLFLFLEDKSLAKVGCSEYNFMSLKHRIEKYHWTSHAVRIEYKNWIQVLNTGIDSLLIQLLFIINSPDFIINTFIENIKKLANETLLYSLFDVFFK